MSRYQIHLFEFHFILLCLHLTTCFLLRFYNVLFSECVIFTSLLYTLCRMRSVCIVIIIVTTRQMRLIVASDDDDDARFDTSFTHKQHIYSQRMFVLLSVNLSEPSQRNRAIISIVRTVDAHM